MVDNRVVSLAGYSHLIEQNSAGSLWGIFEASLGPEDSRETPSLHKKLESVLRPQLKARRLGRSPNGRAGPRYRLFWLGSG